MTQPDNTDHIPEAGKLVADSIMSAEEFAYKLEDEIGVHAVCHKCCTEHHVQYQPVITDTGLILIKARDEAVRNEERAKLEKSITVCGLNAEQIAALSRWRSAQPKDPLMAWNEGFEAGRQAERHLVDQILKRRRDQRKS